MEKAIKFRIVAWCIVLFLLIFLPNALNTPSQIQVTALVSGIGLDWSEKGIEVSAQIIIPQQSSSYAPQNIVVCGEGECIAEAIQAVESKVGQRLGLAHCYIIILGDRLCSEDIPNKLDFLMRSNLMGNNSAIVHTTGEAKELLQASSQLSEGDVNNLQKISKFNHENSHTTNISLIELFNQYMSPSPFSLMSSIDVEKQPSEESGGSDDSQSTSPSGDEEQGGESTQSSLGQKADTSSSNVIKNEGSAIVFKKGRKLTALTKEQVAKINWICPKSKRGIIIVNNFSNNELTDVSLTLSQSRKIVTFSPKIVNNVPILNAHIILETYIDSIRSEQGVLHTSHENYYNTSLVDDVAKIIKRDIAEAMESAKQDNYDVFDIYNIFNAHLSSQWKSFLSTLDDPEDYMQKLEVSIELTLLNRE